MAEAWLEDFFARDDAALAADDRWPEAHAALLAGLERGEIRAAHRAADGTWCANTWVKRAILLGFRR
ncbi:MAG: 2,3,4,5-tetrahydropyridine-2,6-dicarboxylate N-succinyltransferase, partial [Planctomycetes bacterium]|nr:2,3,4,5-tetrahydropyridine-2,6-dicarboxylate N-succinyltransferase [Planctomycetota bacterium]